MNHLDEEQLILHYYGEELAGEDAATHLAGCAECAERYRCLQSVLNTVNAVPVPERGPDYGSAVWSRLEPRLPLRRKRLWQFALRPWVAAPALAFLLLLAFFAGRISHSPTGPTIAANGRSERTGERILLIAVGDHLDRSQMVLAELSNAPDGKGNIDISDEQRRAEDLLEDNRLFRQTAHTTGDRAIASVLDELERTLLEIAHSPSELTADQLAQLQREIADRGLLFKVRVVGSQVQQREDAPLETHKKDIGKA